MKMTTTTANKVQIPDRLYFRIGDVAELIGVKPYVLRYWESEFSMISPQKSSSGQRVYRRSDVETVLMIKHLLYEERYSVEGAKKRIKELRKEGELKVFKEEAVAATTQEEIDVQAGEISSSGSMPESRKELRTLAYELKALAQASISDLFSS